MATKVIQLEGGETYRDLYFRKARTLNVDVFRIANRVHSGSGIITVTDDAGGTIRLIVIERSGVRFQIQLEPEDTLLQVEQRVDLTNQTTMKLEVVISESELT